MNQKEQVTLKEIELLRHKLAHTVDNKGYAHRETIKISQQLDRTLNYYNYLQQVQSHSVLPKQVNSN